MHFLKKEMNEIQTAFEKWPKARKIILVSLLSSIGAIFQSAGGFLPGVGYFISPLSTAPIILCTIFSIPLGLASYVLTALLLLILQPAELIIFPFTTGLLGLFIGTSFHLFRKKLSHIMSGAAGLTFGICLLLYGLKFPVLGPAVSHQFSVPVSSLIIIFSIFYSWIWVVLSTRLVKRICGIVFS
ncbi:hypothetical protein RRV45_19595 [Bacillus sp. DTU_2020_1000418_1_SI_GHA_SEK_038]|uniref:hypothetical protein n=1 Tax=Bacillus sp. DTU_2020_1000418_1_SI_GHA_SEK_038 TaxID=3077585 RepID=UPI0028EAF6B6|nr:hypothetical protein [Bacillus sp. DTU_2020_1000418_1_SI_GHA_SEK_038]WNS75059.1 hypothetical protein RRV45_19595 [Bacillus sp. DTU_2020_1000418_1_SI_GHA_SEK_038]